MQNSHCPSIVRIVMLRVNPMLLARDCGNWTLEIISADTWKVLRIPPPRQSPFFGCPVL